ncbi:MAG: hypothetical protein L0G87_00370 [Renibacterium salmoninarum]|jgi:S-DNA-T family DNA segregation ATPase FtsK/SpoIIIE|nr:hypothetical protein [Renibacterium salmoninarum]
MSQRSSGQISPPMMQEQSYGLAPVRSSIAKPVFTVLFLAVAIAGFCLITKRSEWVIPALVAGTALATMVAVFSLRARRRRDFLDRYTETVSEHLGSKRPLRSMVKAKHWSMFAGWLGFPERLVVRYSDLLTVRSPKWLAELLEMSRIVFGVSYEVQRDDRVKGMLTLKAVQVVEKEAVEEVPEVVARAEQIVQNVFSAGAGINVEHESDQLKAIDIKVDPTDDISEEIRRYRMDSKVMTRLPGRWRSKWDLVEDTVRYEVRKPFPETIEHPEVAPLMADVIKNYDKFKVPFAQDEDGHTISWAPAMEPHFLCVGKSGTGKTVAMHGICAEFSAQGWPVWVVDGKSVEFIGFRRWENFQLVGTYLSEQVRIIHAFHEEMEKRLAMIRDEVAHEDSFLPMLLAIDEYKAFKYALTMIYKRIRVTTGAYKDPTEPEALGLVSDIASRGRSVRMHLLIGLQRPDAAFLTGDMRDNFPARLSMGRLSRDAAQMMWNNFRTGTTLQRKKRGRGISVDQDGNNVEVLVYWTPDPRKAKYEQNKADLELLERLRPKEASHPRLRIVDPTPSIDVTDDGEQISLPVTYRDWATARIVEWTPEDDTVGPPAAMKVVSGVDVFKEGMAIGDPEDEIEDENYQEADYVKVSQLRPGDMICLDEDAELWVRVEGSEEDPLAGTYQCIDWVSDDEDDAAGSESFPSDEQILARVQIDQLSDDLSEAA